MTANVKHVYTANSITTANPTVSVTDTPVSGDVLVLLMGNNFVGAPASAVSGCGATWTRVAGALSASSILDVWIGTGASTSGTVTATATSAANGRALAVHMVEGVTSTAVGVTASGTGAQTTPSQSAGDGQIVFGLSYTTTAASSVTGTTPASGWTEQTLTVGPAFIGTVRRAPSGLAEAHNFTAQRSSGTTYVSQVMLGDYDAPPLDSQFSTEGTLTTTLTDYVTIDSAFTTEGTMQTTGVYPPIEAGFSTEGTLTTTVTRTYNSNFTTEGTLTTAWTNYVNINSNFSTEGILLTELGYVVTPPELGTEPLGKLTGFNVSTSATPLNPAEGSGGTPSVTAGYIKGTGTEFAMGEVNTITHGAVGTYEGEIVRLSLPEGSDVASIAQDTLLTLLNADLTMFPFIDAAPSTWTAARAIDYWSQQCGLFYDKVPGDCIAYASGFGHTDSYGASTTHRFYEKLTAGTPSTAALNNRSVKAFGTGTTAFHEQPETKVAVSVPKNRKLVASIGLGIRGTGRTATVTWNMLDAREASHTVSISATSAGLITASVDGVPAGSTTVAGNANYRVAVSIEPLSPTAVACKLTVHTDDLAGTGTLAHNGSVAVVAASLPPVLYLTSYTHASAGGSGSEMLRWGTYLTVASAHPTELPAVQKSLAQTIKAFGFVSGFEGNVWDLLNEYCAITKQDVRFLDGQIHVAPRNHALSAPVGNFASFSRDSERREKYKQVAVVNKQSKAVTNDTAVLWHSDSVYQVNPREVQEFTVQTPHSILSVVNPVPVPGILPFPYKQGAGQYVVTGADGYIIAPQWWIDNGGKVEVSLTGKEGELNIKITAPAIDSVRAPYRISEGEADRPALYVSGSGILNDPKEVIVGTGARNAKEGHDQVFESPFIAGPMETYDTAAAMAMEYSASTANVSFNIPNDFNTPSRFGQYPSAARFTDGVRNYRIVSASQSLSKVSGSAVPHTTIADYVASFPAGATIADEKARHAGRTIKQFNISPLRGTDATA